MKKTNESWTIEELKNKSVSIGYPEYQREPTVWGLAKKQRLIDSILRGIDISSLYLFKNGENSYDCVDGRQRINAILSFMGENDADEMDNEFHLTIVNEIYEDHNDLKRANNLRYKNLLNEFKERLLKYRVSVVIIEEVEDELELNLFFLRLQLGQILNSGEKLHAMSGDMRETIFKKLGVHPMFNSIRIPYRRFAREQVAAQIALNYFSLMDNEGFHKSKYVDLQQFLKEKSSMNKEDEMRVKGIITILDKIRDFFGKKLTMISNRATAVSVFLYVRKLVEEKRENELEEFVEFFTKLVRTLRWQIPKGVSMDPPYHYIVVNFQNYIIQGADEKRSIEKRNEFIDLQFDFYKENSAIRGDSEYQKLTGENPDSERGI